MEKVRRSAGEKKVDGPAGDVLGERKLFLFVAIEWKISEAIKRLEKV